MGSWLSEGSLFSYIGSPEGITFATIVMIIVCGLVVLKDKTGISIFDILKKITTFIFRISAKGINKRETRYHRDLEIGKITEKNSRVKTYRFLNNLIIDLGLKSIGATPYEFLFILILVSLVVAILICQLLFGNLFMVILIFPTAFAFIICLLYTKANITHDMRIEAILEAENIICNNIQSGVIASVKTSINNIPELVRPEFRDLIDNVESKNYHIKTALQILGNELGSISEDFIKKCIVFELEEEKGIAGMFQDIVEMNGIKTTLRSDMKRRFEEVTNEFILGASMIFVFLAGTLVIFPDVRGFYLKTPLGQFILCLDLLIMLGEFVFITYLKAKEM